MVWFFETPAAALTINRLRRLDAAESGAWAGPAVVAQSLAGIGAPVVAVGQEGRPRELSKRRGKGTPSSPSSAVSSAAAGLMLVWGSGRRDKNGSTCRCWPSGLGGPGPGARPLGCTRGLGRRRALRGSLRVSVPPSEADVQRPSLAIVAGGAGPLHALRVGHGVPLEGELAGVAAGELVELQRRLPLLSYSK